MSTCDCYGCSMKGQGACGCFACTDCGLESLTMLEQDDDTGRHFCDECPRDDQHRRRRRGRGHAAGRPSPPHAARTRILAGERLGWPA